MEWRRIDHSNVNHQGLKIPDTLGDTVAVGINSFCHRGAVPSLMLHTLKIESISHVFSI